ncbi:hypothetical protein [Paraburkholderia ultramafica]|uniref:hypothetical protein n=1 Tax=Paraburkholderia ultramafica TaxID=1544867 RepID=UPI00158388FC|nr:hypothetical protein [Paraburkholderia ultramafica]
MLLLLAVSCQMTVYTKLFTPSKNSALAAQLGGREEQQKICLQLRQDLSSKESHLTALGKQREQALIYSAPIQAFPNQREPVQVAQSPEVERDDAEIKALETSLQTLRQQVLTSCDFRPSAAQSAE